MKIAVVLPGTDRHGWMGHAERLGFITYPTFLDCFFVPRKVGKQKKERPEPDVERFLKRLKELGRRVKIAVLPDFKHDLWEELPRKFDWIVWIAPIHEWRELELVTDRMIIGVPSRQQWRNYRLYQIADEVGERRLWILGLMYSQLSWLRQFSHAIIGFDTTFPAQLYWRGCVFTPDGRIVKTPKGVMTSYEKLLTSIRNFREYLERCGFDLMSADELISLIRSKCSSN